MKYSKWYLILILALSGSFSVEAYCGSSWEAFLDRPNKDVLAALENTIRSSAQRCSFGNPSNQDIAPTTKQNMKLFKLIERGNESAFRAALLVSKCLDGGELEDLYRSTGIFFEGQTLAFLQIVKEKEISESQMKSFLIMLPLDSVDDIDRQILILEKRILLLKRINEGAFQELRNKGLKILEKANKELTNIKNRQG